MFHRSFSPGIQREIRVSSSESALEQSISHVQPVHPKSRRQIVGTAQSINQAVSQSINQSVIHQWRSPHSMGHAMDSGNDPWPDDPYHQASIQVMPITR